MAGIQKKLGALLSYTSQAVTILSGMIYTPIMLRILGQSEYGLYTLVNSVISYLSLLSLGFTSAYVRYYARSKESKDKNEEYRLNGMFMIIFSIMAMVSLICGGGMLANARVIFGNGLTEQELSKAKILMCFMIINMSVSFITSVFSCISNAHEQFIFQQVVNLLQSLLNPFLALPLLLLGYGSIGLVCVSTILTFAKLGANVWFCISKLKTKFIFHGLQWTNFMDMGKFTFFIFLNQIIDQINWSVDKFLLGRLAGTTAVAIYGLGSTLNNMYLQFSNAISYVFVPQVNRLVASHSDDRELSKLFVKVGRIQFVIIALVLSGFIFLGKPFITLWGGSDYETSYYVTLFLIAPVSIPLIQNLGIEIQRAKNKHQTRSIVYALIAILNILISIPLIKIFGATGAAMGTAIALVFGNILFMNWYYQKRIGLDILLFWKEIGSMFPGLIVPILIGCGIKKFIAIDSIHSLVIWGIVYIVMYCLSMWIFGMNQEEKNLIGGVVKRRKRQ